MPRGESLPSPRVWFASTRLCLPTAGHRPPIVTTPSPPSDVSSPGRPFWKQPRPAPKRPTPKRPSGGVPASGGNSMPNFPAHMFFISWPRHSQAGSQLARLARICRLPLGFWWLVVAWFKEGRVLCAFCDLDFPLFCCCLVLWALNKIERQQRWWLLQLLHLIFKMGY